MKPMDAGSFGCFAFVVWPFLQVHSENIKRRSICFWIMGYYANSEDHLHLFPPQLCMCVYVLCVCRRLSFNSIRKRSLANVHDYDRLFYLTSLYFR